MTRPLPPHSNLQQLKHQAKDLCKAHQQGDERAQARVREFLPRSAETKEAVPDGPLSLQEAQHVVAREYGFKHWEMLCTVVKADLERLVKLSNSEV